ncbi:MAG TPA: TRAP transporter large permease, partial [Dehalococcoidia bacterium]|nr:TRAP transporter large permease [Dehalococcoidia bacterium]
NFDMTKLPSSMIAGAESFVLLAIPSFVFAGTLMERCGMSYRLIDLSRAMVGWMRGGLGMTTVAAEYLFSGISGSSIADVSAIGAMVTPPMQKAGYKPEQAVSIVAAATGMGILVPPAIFMIIIGTMTNTSIVGIFLGGFIPALTMSAILMAVIYWQAVRFNWPTDARPSLHGFLVALRGAIIPLFVPIVMLVGFRFGIFTATEAGAIIAFYSLIVALLVYRNVTLRDIIEIAEQSALVTAAVVLLLGAATVYQFLMGILRVPQAIGQLLTPLQSMPWLFLIVVALIVLFFGMVMEGLPAAVILLPVLFPTARAIGIHPIHFCIVVTAAVGVGLFMPPFGVGLLIALRFGNLSIARHLPHYWPYAVALLIGLLVIILVPDLTLWLPKGAGIP